MIGKIVGAIIGYLLTRSAFGAIAGAIAGHFFDQALSQSRRPGVSSDFINPLFAFAGAVSKADGRVSEREIAAAKALMQRMQLGEEQRRAAIDAFNAGKQPGYVVDLAIANLRQWSRGRRDLAFMLLDMLLDIVYADGALTPPKQQLVRKLCQALGVSEGDLLALSTLKGYGRYGEGAWQGGAHAGSGRQGGSSGSSGPGSRPVAAGDPYAVLGLERSASPRDIKSAWRRLMSQHHPDKLGNVPDELKRRAEARARDINAAYEQIKNERGLP